jgi:hypothetical protein
MIRPGKMATEIAKQEKNMRALEHQYKRNMEEEQEEFGQDLINVQADVGKGSSLSLLVA